VQGDIRGAACQIAAQHVAVPAFLHINSLPVSARVPVCCAQAPLVTVGPADPAVVVASMRRNMEALDALSSERAGVW
jgi:programmed cell death 6-interacting protein